MKKTPLPRLALFIIWVVLCTFLTGCERQEELPFNSAKEKNSLCMKTQNTSTERNENRAEAGSLSADWITVPDSLWEFRFSGNPGLMIIFEFPEDGADYVCDCWATGEGMLFIDNGASVIQKESNHQVINNARDMLVWNNMAMNRITPENYADGPGLLEVVLKRDGRIVAYAVVHYYVGETEGHAGLVWRQELLEEYRFTGEEAALSEDEKEQKIHTAFADWEEQYGFERMPEWAPFDDALPEESQLPEAESFH